jgi:protein-L-isoaspartate O-methyltransferase
VSVPANVNKTLSRADLRRPEVAAAAARLRRFALWLAVRRASFAVNGVLRWRWRIKWNKLWEYARGLAYGAFAPGQRVLDFGGGATVPVLYLARAGCEVLSLDIDPRLSAHTNALARRFGWRLEGSTLDLTQQDAPQAWGQFDRVISFCVIEHIPKEAQLQTLARLAALLGRFRQEFDYVFVDTPPVLVVSDARVIGQRSDGVILVLRAGETRQLDALQVVRRLQEDGTNILGTVLRVAGSI